MDHYIVALKLIYGSQTLMSCTSVMIHKIKLKLYVEKSGLAIVVAEPARRVLHTVL